MIQYFALGKCGIPNCPRVDAHSHWFVFRAMPGGDVASVHADTCWCQQSTQPKRRSVLRRIFG
jgi:hypothetical protein